MYVCACMHVYECVHAHVCVYTRGECVCMSVCVYSGGGVHMCVCVCVYVHQSGVFSVLLHHSPPTPLDKVSHCSWS